MENKEKIELLGKQVDIIGKKVIILLAGAAGSGSYAISESGYVSYALFAIFTSLHLDL